MPFTSTLAAIDDWLAEHAPTTWRELAPPATADELADVRRLLGADPLPDVVELLRWHNGAGRTAMPFCLAPGYAFIGTADMIATARHRTALDDRHLFWRTWNQRWLPIATGSRGACLALDHTDGPDRGEVTVSSPEDARDTPKTWSDLDALLRRTYEAMRFGGRFLQRRRVVADGRLSWED